jgi:hypothetical protein
MRIFELEQAKSAEQFKLDQLQAEINGQVLQ